MDKINKKEGKNVSVTLCFDFDIEVTFFCKKRNKTRPGQGEINGKG